MNNAYSCRLRFLLSCFQLLYSCATLENNENAGRDHKLKHTRAGLHGVEGDVRQHGRGLLALAWADVGAAGRRDVGARDTRARAHSRPRVRAQTAPRTIGTLRGASTRGDQGDQDNLPET